MKDSASGRKPYPSDLREAEWAVLEPLVPTVTQGGRPARWSRREIVNAILDVVRGGNQWRAMPHDRPPWQTAYGYFWQWRNAGTWGTDPHRNPRAGAPSGGSRAHAQRGDCRQSVGENPSTGGLRGYEATRRTKV